MDFGGYVFVVDGISSQFIADCGLAPANGSDTIAFLSENSEPVIYTKTMKKSVIKATIITFCTIVAIGILYLARGWIRAELIPGYVSFAYKGTVDKDFLAAFQPVNAQLNTYGVTFRQNLLYHCFSGEDAQFQGLSETVPCLERQGSDWSMPTSSFIASWQHNSPTLERSLLTSGWKKEYNARQSIDGIFSVPNYTETIGVNYAKDFGKVTCTLSISYTAIGSNSFIVNESCERDVSFFGGSEG